MFDISKQKQIIDVVKYRWVWFVLSLILIVPGIVAMVYSSVTNENHYPLNVGIDFTGGTILQYKINDKVNNDEISKLRDNLEKNGIQHPVIQAISNTNVNESKKSNIISIRTQFIDEHNQKQLENIKSVITSEFKQGELVQISSIGPTLGKELFKNSFIAMMLAFLGISVYLSLRFEPKYAIIALYTLVHDAVFVIGAFSLLGIFYHVQIDSLFITALLTVIGFSVHDTIVVFDRVRENCKFYGRKLSYDDIVNASVNQTLARSINTSLTTVLTLLALYFFGGTTTKDFVLAMLLGIIIGTYSSIFVAGMLLAWHNDIVNRNKDKKKQG